LSGAIFTTTFDGTVVNGNTKYDSKCDVYLDGGPGPNAPVSAAGLPAGDYYFQVTDPSGKKLLSTDPVSNRRITVNSSGVISNYVGLGGPPHPTGTDADHYMDGAITVRLANTTCPTDFLDTPNNGGVYKAWVTPVEAFVGNPANVEGVDGHGIFHGFLPAASKTDNFKVGDKAATFCLTIWKFKPSLSLPLPGWEMTVTDDLGVSNTYYTGSNGSVEICGLTPGAFTVTESLEYAGMTFENVVLIVNGEAQSPSETYAFSWTPGKDDVEIVFGNQPALKTPPK